MTMLRSVTILLVISVCAMAQLRSIKPGDCPPPAVIGVCTKTCLMDIQCSGQQKCCLTDCGGSFCTMPVTMRQEKLKGVKAGDCPTRPLGPWVCSSTCVFDGDCRGRLKCCNNRCGAMACMKPEI